MALINTITIDLQVKTAVLTSTLSGNQVETITYINSTNQITFSSRADIIIAVSDFLNFVDQINIFQTAILFNFSNNPTNTIPFGSCNNTENHNIVDNTWNLTCIYGQIPRLVNYSALKSNKTIELFARGNGKTIDFPEWIYFLNALNHYNESLQNFLK